MRSFTRITGSLAATAVTSAVSTSSTTTNKNVLTSSLRTTTRTGTESICTHCQQRTLFSSTMPRRTMLNIDVEDKEHINELINFYSSMEPARVNLNEIVLWLDNPRYDPYIFCHRQLPLLLAFLVKSLQEMPQGLSSMPSITATKKHLLRSFAALVETPVPVNMLTEKRFVEAIREIDIRHSNHDILMKMATGVLELKSHVLRHREAILQLKQYCKERNLPSPSRNMDGVDMNDETKNDKDDKQQGVDFASEILKIQEPLDSFNRALVQYNFISRQLIEFSDRMWENIEAGEGSILRLVEDDEEEEGLGAHDRKMRESQQKNRQIVITKATDKETKKEYNAKDNCLTMRRPTERMSQLVDIESVVRDAIHTAKEICDAHYGDSPDVKVVVLDDPVLSQSAPMMPALNTAGGRTAGSYLTSGANLPTATSNAVSDGGNVYRHITPTVHYIIVELMKNAFRATIERHMKTNALGIVTCEDMPSVRVIINARRGLQHSCICVEDNGTGIKREHMSYVMSYSYTTAKHALSNEDNQSSQSTPPLAGYGYGLPMSRTYARCFGGDLVVQTVEGFGTKTFLYLQAARTTN